MSNRWDNWIENQALLEREYGRALRILRDPVRAEQIAWEAYFASTLTFDPARGPFGALFHVIARNSAWRTGKRIGKGVTRFARNSMPPRIRPATPPEELAAEEQDEIRRRILWQALGRLPRQIAIFLWLNLGVRRPISEVYQVTGLEYGTVRRKKQEWMRHLALEIQRLCTKDKEEDP